MSTLQFNFNSRQKKVMSVIEKNNLDYILITNLQNLYWVSGTAQYGVLLIHKENGPTLFVRRNFFRARTESVIKDIYELKKSSQILEHIKKENASLDRLRIGMELDSLPSSFLLNYQKLFHSAEITNVELELRKLRMVKDRTEIELHRQAGKVAQKTQEVIPKILRPGMKEYEIAAEVMYESMKNRSVHFCNVNATFGRNWFIVASGKNLWTPSSFPILSGSGFSNAVPYGYSDREVKKGEIVTCDYAVNVEGYHADHARTYYVEKIPDKLEERYVILKQAYDVIIDDYLHAGTPVSTIFNKMKELLEKHSIGKFFQGNGYYYHGLGHGVGLELDEPPFILPKGDIKLEENMIIALEPKLLIPDWGAIDLEDNFIVKKGKPEQITNTEYLFE